MADANGHPCGDRGLGSLASAGGNLWGHSSSEKQGLPLILLVATRAVTKLTKALLPSFHPTASFHKPSPSAGHNHLPWAASKPEQSFRLQGRLLSFTNVLNCWHLPREGGDCSFAASFAGKQHQSCAPFVNSMVFPHRAEKRQGSR